MVSKARHLEVQILGDECAPSRPRRAKGKRRKAGRAFGGGCFWDLHVFEVGFGGDFFDLHFFGGDFWICLFLFFLIGCPYLQYGRPQAI